MSLQTKIITLLPGIIAGLVPGLVVAVGTWIHSFRKTLKKQDFIKITGADTSIIINNETYKGKEIDIRNGQIRIDGKSMKNHTNNNNPQLYVYHVQIIGNPFQVVTKGDVTVNGNCGLIQTRGKVRVSGKAGQIVMVDSQQLVQDSLPQQLQPDQQYSTQSYNRE